MHDLVLAFHFCFSAAMSLAGLTALVLRKGSRPHRWAGNLFIGMVPPGIVTGTLLVAMAPEKLLQGWVAAAAIYLALSGWATARRWDGVGRPFTVAAAMLGLFMVATGVLFIRAELEKTSGAPGGVVFLGVIRPWSRCSPSSTSASSAKAATQAPGARPGTSGAWAWP